MLSMFATGCQDKDQENNGSGATLSPSNGFDQQITWVADTTHSSIQFRTRHTEVHDVIGWIGSYHIEVKSKNYDFSGSRVDAWADLRSIVMPNMGMAGNVQGMFETTSFPKASFSSDSIYYDGLDRLRIDGKMMIKGIAKPLSITGVFNGYVDSELHSLPGFTLAGAFDPSDYGIKAPGEFESDGVQLLGDSIFFTANLRMYVR